MNFSTSVESSTLHNTAVPPVTARAAQSGSLSPAMPWPVGVAGDFPTGVFVRFGTKARHIGYRVALDGCWLWEGAIDSSGYGEAFNHRLGRIDKAHRVVWEHYRGPLPARPSALELDHLCRVRHCVNPKHLELVTHDENQRRAVRCRFHLYEYRPNRKPWCRFCGRRKPGPRRRAA